MTGSSIDRTDVMAALRRVVDPCSIAAGAPIDVVDMGLIRHVDIGEARVRIVLQLTSPMCWQSTNIIGAIREAMESSGYTGRVDCEIDDSGEWEPSMMAPSAQVRLRELRPVGAQPAPVAGD